MVLRRILLLGLWIYTCFRWPATSTQLMVVIAGALALYLALNLVMKLSRERLETGLGRLKDLSI